LASNPSAALIPPRSVSTDKTGASSSVRFGPEVGIALAMSARAATQSMNVEPVSEP